MSDHDDPTEDVVNDPPPTDWRQVARSKIPNVREILDRHQPDDRPHDRRRELEQLRLVVDEADRAAEEQATATGESERARTPLESTDPEVSS